LEGLLWVFNKMTEENNADVAALGKVVAQSPGKRSVFGVGDSWLLLKSIGSKVPSREVETFAVDVSSAKNSTGVSRLEW
jgi:hypothetical protein